MDVEESARASAPPRRSAAAAEALLLEVVGRHAAEVLRIARSHSLCLDDAQDAYQRSLEQFLRHGRRLERATAHRWLFTVVKREAMAVRSARAELVGESEVDFERLEARVEPSPEDHALEADAVARGAEALRVLKPHEVRALWLRAEGRTYEEIQAATGWSYTKVNRCLNEGRRRFERRCAELESGAECERWAEVLGHHADGMARAQDLVRLRPHLRACPSCRATLRALHGSPGALSVLLPPGLLVAGRVAPGEGLAGWLARACDVVGGAVHDRAVAGAVQWQVATEAVAGGKLAAVAASSVVLVGGGAAIVESGPEAGRAAAAPGATDGPALARSPARTDGVSPGGVGAVTAAPAAGSGRWVVGGAAGTGVRAGAGAVVAHRSSARVAVREFDPEAGRPGHAAARGPRPAPAPAAAASAPVSAAPAEFGLEPTAARRRSRPAPLAAPSPAAAEFGP